MTLQELQQEAQSLREKLSENLRKQTEIKSRILFCYMDSMSVIR